MTLKVRLAERQDIDDGFGNFIPGKAIHESRVLPPLPVARTLAENIGVPADIRNAYELAQLLLKLKIKAASAVYARRALSGMLADFCGIRSDGLSAQIARLQLRVRKQTEWCHGLAQINRVRASGNIGMHMEAARDTITDVDEGEPEKLLELLDQLADDWYAVRQRRIESNPSGDCCRLPAPRQNWLERLFFDF